ncbi:MAG: sensor histidine kinase RegB [Paracoccaceae bacterium]
MVDQTPRDVVADLDVLKGARRGDWVRLRVLTGLRWMAVTGQVTALWAGWVLFDLRFDLGWVAAVVGVAVLANLLSAFLAPDNRRLSEREATGLLAFDALQLAALLALTGGVSNPFAVLMLAPVTVGATVLRLRATLALGALTAALVVALGVLAPPLRDAAGTVVGPPLLFREGFVAALLIGVGFLGLYARQVTVEMQTMAEALAATQMALSREQRMAALSGVVAAAAHELGTPLATIKLAASELADELPPGDARDDVELIRAQADRCRDILRSMGRAGHDDALVRAAPLETVVREAALPHLDRDIRVTFDLAPCPDGDARQPEIPRRPEIVHGLRNLVQNGVDFARTELRIEMGWSDAQVFVRLVDDGPGFPQAVLARIGDPFVRARRPGQATGAREGYEGMGLGLFIAKTLLERSGAKLSFANGGGRRIGGAPAGGIVEVAWPRGDGGPRRGALGPNPLQERGWDASGKTVAERRDAGLPKR